jgi:hypothetical protein
MLALLEESYFKGYFTTKAIFTPSLFKASTLLLILIYYLALLSPSALEKGFTDFLQIFPKILASPSLHFHLHAPQ